MEISKPRFVVLDTATISCLASDQTDPALNRLRAFIRSAEWIPFITYHHLEELASHESESTFQQRFQFLAALPFLGYWRRNHDAANVGGILDVRDAEISFILQHPGCTHQQVIDAIRPKVLSGFVGGRTFLKENLDWWRFFRRNLAGETRRQKEEVANVTHFPTRASKTRIPVDAPFKKLSPKDARKYFSTLAGKLAHQIRLHGDVRQVDPKKAADGIMDETFREFIDHTTAGVQSLDDWLTRIGIQRSRLPKACRGEDIGYEGIFQKWMTVHGRRLLKNPNDLIAAIRKEEIPSWMVWQEIDRRLAQFPNAEIGNVTDKDIAVFGLFVDVINVDKRIMEILRQGRQSVPLLGEIYSRVPRKSGIRGLVDRLVEG